MVLKRWMHFNPTYYIDTFYLNAVATHTSNITDFGSILDSANTSGPIVYSSKFKGKRLNAFSKVTQME